MADLTDYKCFKNSKYQVLTNDGFRDFEGLMMGVNPSKVKLSFANGRELVCTPKHKLLTYEDSVVYAKDVRVGDVLYGDIEVTDVNNYTDDHNVYELIEVDKTHKYYVNGILSHQCLLIDEMAFIEPDSIVEDFWRSLFPTISRSTKSKVLIASTPNGTGNLFHKLVDGAERGENGFVVDKVKWHEIPGRGEDWKKSQIKALGSVESFLQEYECMFLNTGDSAIDEELFANLSKGCKEPLLLLDEGNYKVWKEPDPDRIYSAGVDISEGVGKDACVINIFDITDPTDIEQVAIYHNNRIPPREFTNRLFEILNHWGRPIALIERNNCGAQVVDRLVHDLGYDKVVSYGAAAAGRNKSQLGMIAHTNTKYKGVLNMRYFVNEMKCVKFNDIDTLKELKNFVRYPNGTWKAKSDFHDDRVMSVLYTLYILEKELCERYFEILDLDDYGKPNSIRPMDYGVTPFERTNSIYSDENIVGESSTRVTPIVFGVEGSQMEDDMSELELEGYTLL
jgi:hypothetical protein